jgi:very-short-patch-repair endonuclease
MVGTDVLCPDGNVVVTGARCTHDALVAGIDARWRSTSGAYLVEGDVAASTVRGGPPRLQRDGIVIASGDSSPQARVRAAKQDNGPVFDVVVEADGRRFDVNDAGYLERANFIHADWNVGWKTTTPGDLVRESTTFAEYFYWRNWRGERINGGYQLNTQIVFANYWQMFTELHWRPARFDDREVGDGTALQRSGRLGWELSLGTDPRQRVTASWSQAAYFVANGFTYSGDGDVTFHALPQLDVELLPSVLIARGEPRYVLTDPATGDHVFGRQAASALGLTVRTTYTFTPRATLQLYGQLFGESVAYRDFGRVPASDREVELGDIVPTGAPIADTGGSHAILNASAVFRWEWRLGSTLFAVYSRSQGADRVFGALDRAQIPWNSGLGAASAQVFLVKLSYWW